MELIAPGGNLSKLKTAILFGADAVYVGALYLSLRAPAEMDYVQLKEAVQFCRQEKRKIYLAANIFLHEKDLLAAKKTLSKILPLNFDAVLASDPGIIQLVKKIKPEQRIHLSVQANTLNAESIKFWQAQGIKRIILARELNYTEIKNIRKHCPKIEIEVFVHGALCLSYSGRCYLSEYMLQRDANSGKCAHPCRYKYFLTEEKDPSRKLIAEEDANGAYLMNTHDLCLAQEIKKLMALKIDAIKIEGRMKSELYAATVTRTYRRIIDHKGKISKQDMEELDKISHRPYSKGFFWGKPSDISFIHSKYLRQSRFVGIAKNYLPRSKELKIEIKDYLLENDSLEILDPQKNNIIKLNAGQIFYQGKQIKKAGAGFKVKIKSSTPISPNSIIRTQK